jgi:hypothetical protein
LVSSARLTRRRAADRDEPDGGVAQHVEDRGVLADRASWIVPRGL